MFVLEKASQILGSSCGRGVEEGDNDIAEVSSGLMLEALIWNRLVPKALMQVFDPQYFVWLSIS